MIKICLNLLFVMALINSGCSAQKNTLAGNIEASAAKQTVEDSVLQKLQSENDIVIAAATENFAWVRSKNYRILTQKKGEWKGYNYHLNLMRNSTAGSPTSFNEVKVDKAAAGALLNYLTENKAWELKGDSENGPCAGSNKTCNINDAATVRLWLISNNAAIAPAYYAPQFFQQCCPNEQRGLLLSITKKIADIVGDAQAAEQ